MDSETTFIILALLLVSVLFAVGLKGAARWLQEHQTPENAPHQRPGGNRVQRRREGRTRG